jgi:hypothetical protein
MKMYTTLRTAFMATAIAFALAGCATIEGGFRYEYDGKVFRADGKTPAKGAAVRLARPGAPEAPDLPEKLAKSSVKYVDKSQKSKADKDGKYVGVLETVKGWKYTEFSGMHSSGPTKPPEPPMLDDVILYVYEKNSGWTGYQMKIPPEAQKDAYSGVRKIHVPDLLLPNKPATTRSTSEPAP